jgi:diacylglycerol O-acyltransferase-1
MNPVIKLYVSSSRHREDSPSDMDIEVLKMEKFGGLFNLAALTLAISLFHSAVMTFIKNGILVTFSDWTCAEFNRDLHLSSFIMFASFLSSLLLYCLCYLYSNHIITENCFISLYISISLLYCGVSSIILFLHPIAPIVSIITILTVLVVALKWHSLVSVSIQLEIQSQSTTHLETSQSQPTIQHEQTQLPSAIQHETQSQSVCKTISAKEVPQTQSQALSPRSAVASTVQDGIRIRSFNNNNNKPSHIQDSLNECIHDDPTISESTPLHDEIDGLMDDNISTRQTIQTNFMTMTTLTTLSSSLSSSSITQTTAISFSSFIYFLLAPTLVFKIEGYPRTLFINISHIFQMLLEALVEATLIYCAFKQFILPVLTEPSSRKGIIGLSLDVLRLSIPSMLVWLACFDLYFNRILQAHAELLMFKNRKFNGPFWNSTSLSHFWRTWNIPVHEWANEYVFQAIKEFVPRDVAVLFTFLLSAILHEVIFSVAFKTIRPYFFLGMVLQVPLVLMTHSLKGTRRGNLVVWISLFCGHPLLEILYLREYLKNHHMFCVK